MNRDKEFNKNKQENPIRHASFLSRRTFWWLKDIFRAGLRNEITEDLLYATLPEHRSSQLSVKFERLWAEELQRKRPSLMRTFFRAYGAATLFWGLLYSAFETANRVAQPLLLGSLVSYFSPGQTAISEREAYYYAAGVIFCSLVPVLTFHPFILFIFETGMKLRIGSSCLIYNKSMKLTKSATGIEGLSGKIINLLSNDVGRYDVALAFVHDLWKGPAECLLLGYFIYLEIGYSGILGMAFLLSFIPLQAWIGKKTATYRMKAAKRTDSRVRFMNEIIQGIQVIKMYTWESSFAKMVKQVRRKEINAIRGGTYIRATLTSFFVISRVSIFLSLLSYTYTGNLITARKVFITSSFFSILNESMVHFWPLAITFCAEGYISVKRVQEFLLTTEGKPRTKAIASATEKGGGALNENEEKKVVKSNGTVDNSGENERLLVARRVVNLNSEKKGIVMEDVTARWFMSEEESNVGITSVTTTIEEGRLCVVIGSVGSGKTTFLQVLLGELEVDEGLVQINGSVSYAAQEPWLFEDSIRNNILFVEEYDEQRYLTVIKICALERDFELFPHGDQTIVGERGISLSGGQKARVNLARAVYKRSDIYLLDDPLSAVDTHVGKHIYEMCIRDFLSDKVCVLVTHQLQYLKDVQHVLLMEAGCVETQGTFRELKRTRLDSITSLSSEDSSSENQSEQDFKKLTSHCEKSALDETKQEEVRESQGEGKVELSVYKTYITAIDSYCWIMFIVLLIVLAQIALSSVDYFVAEWVNWEESLGAQNGTLMEDQTNENTSLDTNSSMTNYTEERQQYILTYSILIGIFVYLLVQRTFSFYHACLRISINLHDRMFRGLTRATMHFFNTNPSGRILNRFSKDIGAIDTALPMSLFECSLFMLEMLAVVTLVSIVNQWFLVPTIVIAIVMYYIRRIYLTSSRTVKRIESVNRSPLFAQTNATIQGLSTIRAFHAQDVLIKEFNEQIDINTSAWYIFITTTRAFALWLDFVCVVYIAVVTLSLVKWGQHTLGGSVGLAITQTISLVGMCQWGMRQSAELENQMVSVERVTEYTNLKPEPPLESEHKYRPQRNWPEDGMIKFSNVDLSYSDDGEKVLKDLNFTIWPNEKIGIVGRTGAGKSSLIQALFRLAPYEGVIEIDGLDTKTLGLKDLRSKISIIPQDPILFSGTLRSNLDPFEEKNDEQLWDVLDQVELKEAISSFAGGLECKMSDGGSNFSMGQRQLVCLARAMLRKNKILVLDEATANVDPETDKLIQTTIRTKFAECTVLTIAHRLHTVMDSDRVLVMDAGRVVEFGHPHKLMNGGTGYLRRLVEQTGVATAAALMRIADENHKIKTLNK
ncbi:probable multidrug resistance-associated protein lethal(2)03659 [Malaya genurostris]|uniref:probable multidrug resistance-associated protein lethal(2)03659 n=1 Tax=Malaya genurostris TaxID=325434 RepID=UPI0026F3C442|nr:probable multidrug resistance-associated protein lethal(2)03659 [Malaya genurostris]XP_058461296.1 probable multidrug resistance-associated protein lethal(2)03659 [Malaya genurostris]XP_058461303.1 probable multidrug resistance-associated protein lethal(2)03659 [Malaya genurostris]XP_058461313.1 probable multidrug resistance-associated protein lethal(2)03659 [Malaya genurostris]XP_058461324.1 probable multidrug resistance-associated protein lethal(2)03659 [Malaya genurostris]XP_058461332.1 